MVLAPAIATDLSAGGAHLRGGAERGEAHERLSGTPPIDRPQWPLPPMELPTPAETVKAAVPHASTGSSAASVSASPPSDAAGATDEATDGAKRSQVASLPPPPPRATVRAIERPSAAALEPPPPSTQRRPTPVDIAVVPAIAPGFSSTPALDRDYRIQLAAVRGEIAARLAWDRFQVDLGPALAGVQPYIERAETAIGVYYRLQIGPFANLEEAEARCDEIKRRSASCFVIGR